MIKHGGITAFNLFLILSSGHLLITGCSKQKAELVIDSGIVAYADSTAEFPRLIFTDGQVSQNDRCMVRMSKLNRKMPAIYINGKPVGFC